MVVRTDNFQRANSASLGSNWTPWSWTGSASAQVISDAATGNTSFVLGAGNWWNADVIGNTQFSLITVATVPTGSDWVGVTVRQSGNGGNGYLAIWFSGNFYLFRENGTGTPPQLGSAVAGALAVGDSLCITASGTTITVYHNGAQVIQQADATTASGSPGVAFVNQSGSASLWMGGDGATPPLAGYSSTDGNGTQTWYAVSASNLPGPNVVRIRPPSSPAPGRPHSFLFALPVEVGTGSTFGDPVQVICQDLNGHNAYNTTVVVPSFPVAPWYGNSATLTGQQQDTFMTSLATFMAASQFASGGEGNYLIGFSKSGIGGQGLQFRHPAVFAATASWDFPAAATALNVAGNTLTDASAPGGAVSGDPNDSYGTDANFQAGYRLSSGNITGWISGQNYAAVRRLWIGGSGSNFTFPADMSSYATLLTGLSVRYDAAYTTAQASHAWLDPWVAAALASIMPARVSSGLLMASGII